ncbi:MAG: hypothetical protein Q8910_00840 [Bacteroidota bacterium]|nr:hypothetical protein [Bacteroidota bacterium]
MATQNDQTVHSGHTIYLKIGGTVIGKAQGLDAERSFGTEGIYEIGSIMPQEHVNNRYEGSFTLERFFVRRSSLAELGFASLGEEVLRKNVITIAVYDKTTNELVRSYERCTIVNYRETFRVNAIAGENATFTYLSSSNTAAS